MRTMLLALALILAGCGSGDAWRTVIASMSAGHPFGECVGNDDTWACKAGSNVRADLLWLEPGDRIIGLEADIEGRGWVSLERRPADGSGGGFEPVDYSVYHEIAPGWRYAVRFIASGDATITQARIVIEE